MNMFEDNLKIREMESILKSNGFHLPEESAVRLFQTGVKISDSNFKHLIAGETSVDAVIASVTPPPERELSYYEMFPELQR